MTAHWASIARKTSGEWGVFCQPCSQAAGDYTRCPQVAAEYPKTVVGASVSDGQCEPATEPGSPTEPRDLVGMLANQIAREWFGQHRYIVFGETWVEGWERLTPQKRELWMTLGSVLFSAGREAGDQAAELELQRQATTWRAYAEHADRREETQAKLAAGPPKALGAQFQWGGRAVAFGTVADELELRIRELRGEIPTRLAIKVPVFCRTCGGEVAEHPDGNVCRIDPPDLPPSKAEREARVELDGTAQDTMRRGYQP